MISLKKTFSNAIRPINPSRLRKHQSLAIGIFVITVLLIVSVSSSLNGISAQKSMVAPSADEKQVNTTDMTNTTSPSNLQTSAQQQFQCDVVYAYVGKGNSTDVSSYNGNVVYPLSQYPSAIYFNFTRAPNATIESCDAVFEVYLIEIVTDKGSVEKYIWLEGTNINPSFSNCDKVQSAASHVDDLIDRRTLTGQGGHFKFNWKAGTSVVGGCIGSIGRYTNQPSGLGLWNAGQPNAVSVNIRLLGWITINGDSISTTLNSAKTNSIIEIPLQKLENGFIHNAIVSINKLSQVDLFNPTLPSLEKTTEP